MSAGLLAYATFRVLRSQLNPGLIRDTFPSLVCPFVLLPVLSVLRTVRGAAETASVRHDAICLAFALVLLEGVAPLAGKGTADYGDVGAFVAGAVIYRLSVTRGFLGKFRVALRCGVGGKCLGGSAH
jgi:hypothetical protein